MDKDEQITMFCGAIIGLTVGCGLMVMLILFPTMQDIKSGKDFIYGNATYKCEKTNELIEEG